MFRKRLWRGNGSCSHVSCDLLPGYFQWHYFQNHPNCTWTVILFFKPKYWKDKQESFILFIASETKSNVLHFLQSHHLLSLSLFYEAIVYHFLITVFLVVSFKHVSHNLFPIFSQHYNYYCEIILALPHPLLSENDFILCSLSEPSLPIVQDFLYSRIYLFNIFPELTVFFFFFKVSTIQCKCISPSPKTKGAGNYVRQFKIPLKVQAFDHLFSSG